MSLVAVGVHVRPRSESLIQCRGALLEPSGSRAVLSAVRWESNSIMPDAKHSKVQLRNALRQQRQALTASQQQDAAQAAAHNLCALPHWQDAKHIALYLAADGEIDTTPLAAICRENGKHLFLPVIQTDQQLIFRAWDSQARLQPNRYGIPEPPTDAPEMSAEKLDIIVLPLVGWDECGNRLGMGGGFYDKTLTGVNGPLRVGLAHELQRVAQLPLEKWDISLNFVATEAALYACQGAEPQGRAIPE